MLNMSNDAVLRKKVPFYCYKRKIVFFTYLFKKFEKNCVSCEANTNTKALVTCSKSALTGLVSF